MTLCLGELYITFSSFVHLLAVLCGEPPDLTTEEHFIVYLEHIFIIHSSGCLIYFHIVALVSLTRLNKAQ